MSSKEQSVTITLAEIERGLSGEDTEHPTITMIQAVSYAVADTVRNGSPEELANLATQLAQHNEVAKDRINLPEEVTDDPAFELGYTRAISDITNIASAQANQGTLSPESSK